MKKILSFFVLMCVSLSAMASEMSVKNADGVDIWYDFDSSTKTASVTYKGKNGYSYDKEYTGEVVIPSKVTYKGEVYSVTSIRDYAFAYCSSLKSITLPESVTSIGNYAFCDCCGLYEVYNKSNLTITAGSSDNGYVAYYAKNVYSDSEGESKLKTVGDYIFYVDGEDIELIAYTGSETSITLPSDYEGKNYGIGDFAFYDCDALTSITLPEGVTSIGDEAFRSCNALTSINLPEGLTSIGYAAFYECDALTIITLPEGLTSIGKYAFNGCYSLTSITIPEGVTSIGDFAFRSCTALTSITLPEGLTSIGYEAFCDCDALTSITIPEGVTSIGDHAFRSCDALTSITLPESLTSIGDRAFRNCTDLTSITSKNATPPTIDGSYTFDNVDKSIPVYVPKSSVEAYKSAEYWKDFTNIVGKYYIVDIEAENGTVEGAGAYEENAKATLTATPAEGYKFVQWSDGVTDNPRTITITEDVSLEAIFEKETSTAIENENVDAVSVRLIGNRVVVEGADDYTVYSISGQNLGKVESVERGIYIVVVNGKSYKVVAK